MLRVRREEWGRSVKTARGPGEILGRGEGNGRRWKKGERKEVERE